MELSLLSEELSNRLVLITRGTLFLKDYSHRLKQVSNGDIITFGHNQVVLNPRYRRLIEIAHKIYNAPRMTSAVCCVVVILSWSWAPSASEIESGGVWRRLRRVGT